MKRTTNRIIEGVMIETLYAEGVRWAGWYSPANLHAKWADTFGGFMADGQGARWGTFFETDAGWSVWGAL